MRFLTTSFALLLPISLSLAQTTGPCDNTLGGPCDGVRVATTCFASIGMGSTREVPANEVYRCVDDQDAESAKKQV